MPLGPCLGAIVPRAGTVVEIRCFLIAGDLSLALAAPSARAWGSAALGVLPRIGQAHCRDRTARVQNGTSSIDHLGA